MRPEEGGGQAVRQELERVLSSAGFARSERLSRFLRLVVERHLEGRDAELKEPLIATEIYGRKPDYDPKQDSIVRTEAGRLRARLLEYYAGEGIGDALIIELPKGGYAPVFRQQEAAPKIQEAAPKITDDQRKARSKWLWLAATLVGLTVGLAAIGWWRLQHKSTPISIAVLPLENLNRDPANDYFADGLTDELIRNLSIIDGLAPRSRTSCFAFKGKPRNVREVGKQLGVDYLLEGSVLRAGQQLRINAQLVRVRDDSPIWSFSFDRELTDVFAIQDEISRGIVNTLRLKLGGGRRRYETSVEAYDLYLRGRAQAVRRGGSSIVESIELLEQVIAKDPSFAPAYGRLAADYALRSVFFPFDDPAGVLLKMRAAAEKAIQLDPLLAEAHDALGYIYARDHRWEQSEKSFLHAIALDPNRSITYGHFAVWLLLRLGRVDEALHQLRVAEKIDPLSPAVHRGLWQVLLSAGRYDEAVAHCLKLPADDEQKAQRLARARLAQGRTEEAIQLLTREGTRVKPGFGWQDPWDWVLGYAYARSGRREEAEKLAVANSNRPEIQTLIYAGLGDKNRTLEAFDRMAAAGHQLVGWYLTFPELALLRGDPRLKAIQRKAGLPE